MPWFMISNGLLKVLCQIIATTCDCSLSRYNIICPVLCLCIDVLCVLLFRTEKELILTDVLHFCKLIVIYSIRYIQCS